MSDQEQRTPEEIRKDIEKTREELGDTAAAVADKADVKKQARSKVEETKGKVKAKVEEAKGKAKAKSEQAKTKAQEAAPDSAGAGAHQAQHFAVSGAQQAQQAQQFARDNPVSLAIAGAFIAGLALGKLLSR